MKNTIPYLLLAMLLAGKAFAWWMILWIGYFSNTELTLVGMFEPIHQFSYLIISTLMLVGILFRSTFALIVLLLTFLINILVYIFHGTIVYQSVWDPVLLVLFVTVTQLRKPNSWERILGVNKPIHATSA